MSHTCPRNVNVFVELNTPQSRQPPPLRPHNLLAALHTLPQIRRLLSTREQQDAHELFVVLAEAISNESLKVVAEIARIRGMADVLSLQAYCFDKGSVRSYTPSVSSVGTEGRDIGKERRTKIRGLAQPWEGLVARRRVCKKCGYCGEVRMDTLGGLELPTPMAVSTRYIPTLTLLGSRHAKRLLCRLFRTRAPIGCYMRNVFIARDNQLLRG